MTEFNCYNIPSSTETPILRPWPKCGLVDPPNNIIADVVDTIAEVAFVIPTFHEQVIEDISERRFYSVPTKFLMRDEYGNMSFEEQISFSVQNDELSKKYLKAQNKTQRDKMYRLLLDTLARNGGPVDAADDSTTSSGDEDDVDMI